MTQPVNLRKGKHVRLVAGRPAYDDQPRGVKCTAGICPSHDAENYADSMARHATDTIHA